MDNDRIARLEARIEALEALLGINPCNTPPEQDNQAEIPLDAPLNTLELPRRLYFILARTFPYHISHPTVGDLLNLDYTNVAGMRLLGETWFNFLCNHLKKLGLDRGLPRNHWVNLTWKELQFAQKQMIRNNL
jgi:hypothetical protein